MRSATCCRCATRCTASRPTREGFYAVYAGLIAVAAALVLFGSDALLGLLTNAVQTLAGVLLPSATVFLLLLCNDNAVLGPWVNGRWLNLFTGAVIWVLVMLSIILTAATVFPDISGTTIVAILGGGTVLGAVGFAGFSLLRRGRADGGGRRSGSAGQARTLRATWRMPPLDTLAPPHLSLSKRIWMIVLRAYLVARRRPGRRQGRPGRDRSVTGGAYDDCVRQAPPSVGHRRSLVRHAAACRLVPIVRVAGAAGSWRWRPDLALGRALAGAGATRPDEFRRWGVPARGGRRAPGGRAAPARPAVAAGGCGTGPGLVLLAHQDGIAAVAP